MRNSVNLHPDAHPLLTPLVCLIAATVLFLAAVIGLGIQNSNTADKAAHQAQANCLKIEKINKRIREVIIIQRDEALLGPGLTSGARLAIVATANRTLDKFAPDTCPLPQ